MSIEKAAPSPSRPVARSASLALSARTMDSSSTIHGPACTSGRNGHLHHTDCCLVSRESQWCGETTRLPWLPFSESRPSWKPAALLGGLSKCVVNWNHLSVTVKPICGAKEMYAVPLVRVKSDDPQYLGPALRNEVIYGVFPKRELRGHSIHRITYRIEPMDEGSRFRGLLNEYRFWLSDQSGGPNKSAICGGVQSCDYEWASLESTGYMDSKDLGRPIVYNRGWASVLVSPPRETKRKVAIPYHEIDPTAIRRYQYRSPSVRIAVYGHDLGPRLFAM